jgi:hypothetical protein
MCGLQVGRGTCVCVCVLCGGSTRKATSHRVKLVVTGAGQQAPPWNIPCVRQPLDSTSSWWGPRNEPLSELAELI